MSGRRATPRATVTKGRSCDGKQRYTHKGARTAALHTRIHFAARIYAYPCAFGDHWHIGHRPGTESRR